MSAITAPPPAVAMLATTDTLRVRWNLLRHQLAEAAANATYREADQVMVLAVRLANLADEIAADEAQS